MWTLDVIYNKERREKLRKKYEYETNESRWNGAAKVWIYMIFSILLLVFAISRIEKPVL